MNEVLSYRQFADLCASVADFPELTAVDLQHIADSGGKNGEIGPEPPPMVQWKISARIFALRLLYTRGIFERRANTGAGEASAAILRVQQNHRRRSKNPSV